MMTGPLIVDGIFEARLVRENKSAKGIFITLEIAADDYYAAQLESLRPNALLRIGYQELTDVSVQPIETKPASANGRPSDFESENSSSNLEAGAMSNESDTLVLRVSERGLEHSEVIPKREHPLSSQCALRCKDSRFRVFMLDEHIDEMVRADGDVIKAVRSLCDVKSRAELDDATSIRAQYWRNLETEYQNWTAEQAHGKLAR